jgi:hypothetical protein
MQKHNEEGFDFKSLMNDIDETLNFHGQLFTVSTSEQLKEERNKAIDECKNIVDNFHALTKEGLLNKLENEKQI